MWCPYYFWLHQLFVVFWLQQNIQSGDMNPVAFWHLSTLLWFFQTCCCCSPSAARPPGPAHPSSPPQHRLSSQWTNFVIESQTAAGERPRPTNATWVCNMWSCVTPDQDSGPLRGAKVEPESINSREAKRRKENRHESEVMVLVLNYVVFFLFCTIIELLCWRVSVPSTFSSIEFLFLFL